MLWAFPKNELIYKHLSIKQDESASQVIRNDLNAAYVEYMSAALGCPPTSTLISALEQGFLGTYHD